MICLADNDALLKLAACDLIERALTALEVQASAVHVPVRARFSLPSQAKRLGSATVARLGNFLSSARTIDWPIPDDELRLFEDTLGIDAGEAVLYAATANLDAFLIASGDKVSMRALVASPECAGIVERLAGRVICLEQIVGRCITHHGFNQILSCVSPALDCDKALQIIFSGGLSSTADSVNDGLTSYINDLRRTTGSLLAP